MKRQGLNLQWLGGGILPELGLFREQNYVVCFLWGGHGLACRPHEASSLVWTLRKRGVQEMGMHSFNRVSRKFYTIFNICL